MVRKVSAVVRKRIPYTTALFWKAITAIASGTVKTTWKYSVSRSSVWRAASQRARARAWHFGQCRFAHEL
jgi:hypothetical protein